LGARAVGLTGIARDAWRTIVPAAGDKHGPLAPLLLLLTAVTGVVDAFSYLTLGHVFVANMTGNVVFLAFALAGPGEFSIAASLSALAAFSVGAFIGGRLNSLRVSHRGRLLAAACACQSMLIVIALVIDLIAGKALAGFAQYALIALLGLAMGLQNAVARKLAVPDLTTTVLTLTIVGISADARVTGGSGSRIGRRLLAVICMFAGALAGALLVLNANGALALGFALVLLAIVTATAALVSREQTSWSRPG
jgi:uncharacterized membrane protein YoaK (UPF0700 family)